MIKIIAMLITVAAPIEPSNTRQYEVKVTRCYDGDTCTVDFHVAAPVGLGIEVGAVFSKQGVRLCDIDAPELRGGTEESKLLARMSRDTLLSWIEKANRVQLLVQQKKKCDWSRSNNCDAKGKYGRWLGYIIADGVNLNQKLVESGLAVEYRIKCGG